jgi:DNA-binding transcriptional LysR family regulator
MQPPQLNLKRAHYFVVLAEELHFGRAAARLYIAQPWLSQQIKTLEAELGVRLVDRGGRETRLTSAGELLYQRAVQLLRETEELVGQVQARADGRTNRLTVGFSRSTTYLETTGLVHEFRLRHPEVQVSTTVAWTALNVEMLRAHNADVAFLRPPVEEPDLEVRDIFADEHVVALAAGHPLAHKAALVPDDIVDEPIVLWPRKNGPAHYDRLVSQIWGHGRPRLVLDEPDDEQLMVEVGDGVGISIVELHRAQHIKPANVVIRPFSDPVPTCNLAIAWRRSDHTPGVEAFVELCQHQYRPDVAV